MIRGGRTVLEKYIVLHRHETRLVTRTPSATHDAVLVVCDRVAEHCAFRLRRPSPAKVRARLCRRDPRTIYCALLQLSSRVSQRPFFETWLVTMQLVVITTPCTTAISAGDQINTRGNSIRISFDNFDRSCFHIVIVPLRRLRTCRR
jgi:hypothetical protein